MSEYRCCVCMTTLVPEEKFDRFLGIAGSPWCSRRCPDCGLIQRANLPAPDDPADGLEYGEYTAGDNSANQRSLIRIDWIRSLLPEDGLLLDVGAGSGAFVKEARNRGVAAHGIEMLPQDGSNPWIVNHDIVQSPFIFNGRKFDVINLNHVLEHVAEPLPFLRGIHASLSDSGVLIVEVPNEVRALSIRIKQALGKKTNSKTAYLDHRLFFDRKSLLHCLHAAGYQIAQCQTPRVCYNNGWLHENFDRFQSFVGQGNVLEVLVKKLPSNRI